MQLVTPEAATSDTVTTDGVPTSFGVFKPVGYVMLGLPTQAHADAVAAALHGAGRSARTVFHFAPQDSVGELEAAIEHAGPLAGFGYEITLLRRYLALAKEGWRWLLVSAEDDERAAKAAALASAGGATLAVHYRTLTVEDLI